MNVCYRTHYSGGSCTPAMQNSGCSVTHWAAWCRDWLCSCICATQCLIKFARSQPCIRTWLINQQNKLPIDDWELTVNSKTPALKTYSLNRQTGNRGKWEPCFRREILRHTDRVVHDYTASLAELEAELHFPSCVRSSCNRSLIYQETFPQHCPEELAESAVSISHTCASWFGALQFVQLITYTMN